MSTHTLSDDDYVPTSLAAGCPLALTFAAAFWIAVYALFGWPGVLTLLAISLLTCVGCLIEPDSIH